MSLTGSLLLTLTLAAAPDAGVPVQAKVRLATDADVAAALPSLSNWGRWGEADELGTLNLITPAQVKRAAALVRTGERVSLARKVSILETPGIREGSYELTKQDIVARDRIGSIWHGYAQTHLDGLCHLFADAKTMFNGHSTDFVDAKGCKRLGIEKMAEKGIAGRGVLLDIGRLKGGALAPGTPVMPSDLEAAARAQKVKLQPGDIVLVRTGTGLRNTREIRAGLHPDCLFWMKAHDVALLGTDGDADVAPLEPFDRYGSAFHTVAIPHLGLPLIDNAELDAVAATAEKLKRWEFLFVLAPWRLEGATSAPANPLAIF